MKDNSEDRFVYFMLAVLILVLVAFTTSFIVVEYGATRGGGIRGYQRVLEDNLQGADFMNLNRIRAGLRQWMVGYEELEVPKSYTNAHKKVEGALAEADALAERFPTMRAPEFQSNLTLLQTKVHFVPPISAELYGERNPWFPGFLRFVLFGTLKFAALTVVTLAVIGGVVYLADRSQKPQATSSSPSASTTSGGGGGSGGWPSGASEYPRDYVDSGHFPPPTYRPPPIGRGW